MRLMATQIVKKWASLFKAVKPKLIEHRLVWFWKDLLKFLSLFFIIGNCQICKGKTHTLITIFNVKEILINLFKIKLDGVQSILVLQL